MSNIKIVIGPAKSFNTSKVSLTRQRPKHINKANALFEKEIKPLSLEETKEVYGISDKIASKTYQMHQESKEIYDAIEVFDGLVFKQLKLQKYSKEWVNSHVLIIDPLYGPLRPHDAIKLYRLDLKSKINTNLVEYWKEEIQEELKGFRVINLASKEWEAFLEGIDYEVPKLDPSIKQIKVARGKKLNELILENQG